MAFYFIIFAFYLLGLKSYYQALLKQIIDNFSKKLCNLIYKNPPKPKLHQPKNIIFISRKTNHRQNNGACTS